MMSRWRNIGACTGSLGRPMRAKEQSCPTVPPRRPRRPGARRLRADRAREIADRLRHKVLESEFVSGGLPDELRLATGHRAR